MDDRGSRRASRNVRFLPMPPRGTVHASAKNLLIEMA
jgi:hypothetical protein